MSRKTHAFRPGTLVGLEDRVVLSASHLGKLVVQVGSARLALLPSSQRQVANELSHPDYVRETANAPDPLQLVAVERPRGRLAWYTLRTTDAEAVSRLQGQHPQMHVFGPSQVNDGTLAAWLQSRPRGRGR